MQLMLIVWTFFLGVFFLPLLVLADDELSVIELDQVHTGQLLFETVDSNSTANNYNTKKLYRLYILAPALSARVNMNVDGVIALVEVSQRFSNTINDWKSGIYVFPLSHDSAVSAFSMKVGDWVIEGETLEKQKAKITLNTTKKAEGKVALLTQFRSNMFATKVENIPPGKSIEVSLTYFQAARYHSGEFLLKIPLIITPRFRSERFSKMALLMAGDNERMTAPDFSM